MAETCGAKTRSGEPCKRAPVPGKTRCKLHGGLSIGSPGHQNAKTHGIYSSILTDEEMADAAQVEIGTLEVAIRLQHIEIKRIMSARKAAQNRPELDEVTISEDGQTHKQRVVDYDSKLDRAVRTLASLETQHKSLIRDNASDDDILQDPDPDV